MLKEGDIILVAHRRLFENDEVRFFVGCVDEYEDGIVRVTGRSYIRDVIDGRMVEKAEKRTKLLSLSAGTFFFYCQGMPNFRNRRSIKTNTFFWFSPS